ncbi:MAG: outer membrane lipoprotein-sorting protein [bacterium]
MRAIPEPGYGKILITAVLFTILSLLSASSADAKSRIDPVEILVKVDDLWRGESSYADFTMEVTTVHWQRSLKMKAWSLGKDYSLIIITHPPKERGVATLKALKDIWNYLPRVNRVIRVPTSMMMAGWMGSHFTNDDLVKESRMSEDYDVEITFDGTRNGSEVYDLTLTPKPEAPVVWGKIVITVTKDDLLPTESLYFDEEGELARSMVFTDIRMFEGRRVPATLTLTPADKPMEKTVVRYEDMKFGLGLDTKFFSLRNLSRKGLAQ